MVNFSIDGHIDQGNVRVARVWYSSNAALNQGEAVCYNWDYGTAGDREPSRYNRVETPTTLNAQHFAGVSACSHPAVSGGQFIEIYLPGSVCNVWFNEDVVIGVGAYTFDVTSSYEGFFRYEGLPGVGSVIPLQTVTRQSTAGVGLAYLMEGLQSGGVEVVPLVSTGALGTLMFGGTTLITGGSIASGDNTYTLADPLIVTSGGLKKKFKIITTELTSYDVVITITNGVIKDVGTTALATVTFNNSVVCLDKGVTFEWNDGWGLVGLSKVGPVVA